MQRIPHFDTTISIQRSLGTNFLKKDDFGKLMPFANVGPALLIKWELILI